MNIQNTPDQTTPVQTMPVQTTPVKIEPVQSKAMGYLNSLIMIIIMFLLSFCIVYLQYIGYKTSYRNRPLIAFNNN